MKVCANAWAGYMGQERLLISTGQRQTVISQFYQLDRLVVEGGAAVGVSSHR
jgi:hypothetical protein